MISKNLLLRSLQLISVAAISAMTGAASAAPLNITDNPLFLNASVAPLNMLVVGRDHKLFYEAYADHSDLTGDGTLDVGYQGLVVKPDGKFKIDYYGYFDSYKCYTHDGAKFVPASVNTTKKCSSQWSGDWLNWATTSRIDALRKVLYGGKRSTDNATDTVLERSLIPQDAHSWGKEYTSVAIDGYNIADVTPYPLPAATTRHFFASTTLMTTTDWTTNTGAPELRIALDQPSPRRIWNWVSKEAPVAGATLDIGAGNVTITPAPTVLPVRVQVCVSGLRETNCKQYPDGNYKPTGLLQDFGENDTMLFGLLTGSYTKSKSGGVLRKDVGTIKDEINTTTNGTFKALVGIIKSMDQLRPAGYSNYTTQAGGYGTVYNPGLVTTRPFDEGEFGGNWGNPVGEMMYEALRYFAGKTGPSTDFNYTSPGIDGTAPLSLPKVDTWTNPYRSGQPSCAKPFEMVMSDINTSYDSDQVPGSYFNGYTGDLSGLNASDEADKIWKAEFPLNGNYFIGQSGATYDGAPTAKPVTSFSNIRGLSPEEPTKQGSYYSASVAKFGLQNDLSSATGDQKAQTFSIALASPLPRIEIPVGAKTVTLVPFAKSVAGASIDAAAGKFQPTNQIVDFYVEAMAADRKSGAFQVNFEDVEAGNDHDMDAIVRYAYVVNADNTVTVTLSSDYAAGGIVQHMGYVISGTTKDGIYLEVRDRDTTADTDYFLDTPPAFTGTPPAPNTGTGKWSDGVLLPLLATRTFTPGTTAAANVLKDPLWYAAKWGGFEDSNSNNIPDVQSEWDKNGDGVPDNYFLVTNALKLGEQLSAAFDEIIQRTGSASSASVNTGSISSDTRVYQAKFNSGDWRGQLLSFPVNVTDGTLLPAEWDAADKLAGQTPTSRVIITQNADTGNAVPFRWANIGTTRQEQLKLTAADANGSARLDYLRGDDTKEKSKPGGIFRTRVTRLGDIVSSSPVYVGKPPFGYRDTLESQPYSAFVSAKANRPKMVYVGANDGMMHAFDAGTSAAAGEERLGFIPSAVFGNLIELSKPKYSHKFFVDGTPTIGDAFYSSAWHTVLLGSLNKGGKSIFALDVTDPGSFTEANATSIFRWEFKHADLGYTYSRPAIVRMNNGKWAAVFGNGYNNTQGDTPISTTGRASLFIVDIETGALIRQITTNAGSAGTPNGLATPALVDINGDSIVDYAYAGDLLGNMWKFNLTSTSSGSWARSYGTTPLFVAKDAAGNRQPITSKPEVTRGPKGQGLVVLVGTGKFMEQADKSPTQTQSFYGFIDQNTGVTATDAFTMTDPRTVLTQQQILGQGLFPFIKKDGTTVKVPLRVTSDTALGNNRGWYMDFLNPPTPGTFVGEMQVSNSVLRNGRIVFTTLIPDADPCSAGGSSWLMEMDALTGSRLTESPFDPNEDGVFTEADWVTITLPDGTKITVPASGVQSEVGIAQGPGILFDPGNGASGAKEYKYLSGSSANSSGSNLQRVIENPGPNSNGRQSWRQLK